MEMMLWWGEERKWRGGGGGGNGGEKETTVRCWKTLVWKWSGLQCKWILIFNSYITFLGNVSVLLVDDDDGDIFPAVFICWCHVRRLSDDEENCLSPPLTHGPGRCWLSTTPRWWWWRWCQMGHGRCSCSALLCLGIPSCSYMYLVPTSCNHLIRRHTHTRTHIQSASTYLPRYFTYTLNLTKQEKEENNSK